MGRMASLVQVGLVALIALDLPSRAEAVFDSPKMLSTSSVAYCALPNVLVVNTAALTLYPENKTVEFQLSAGSVASNVNVTVNIHVNAYGLGVVDFSLDLCSIAGGILCPLPTYQFNGGGIYPIPEEYLSKVPSIAYSIPDLEAIATLSLTSSSTGQVVDCVQVTLTNGHTARQSGAKWASVGLALFALFSSLLHSCIGQSVGAAQWRVVDVMLSIQHIAVTALLSLNFPSVFVSYAVNFAWSLGLVDISSLQKSITSTRAATGGHTGAQFGNALTAQTALNAVNAAVQLDAAVANGGSVNLASTLANKLFSVGTSADGSGHAIEETQVASTALSSIAGHFAPAMKRGVEAVEGTLAEAIVANRTLLASRAAKYAPNTGPNGTPITTSSSGTLPIVLNSTDNYGGVDLFVQKANIAPDNAFATVLVSMFIFIAIIVGALLLTLGIAWLFRLATRRSEGSVSHWAHRVTRPSGFAPVVAATAGRALLVIFPAYIIFAFYQWKHGDSWVPTMLAAVFLAFLVISIIVFFAPLFKEARRSSPETFYYSKHESPVYANRVAKVWGHMAHPYRPKYFWFALVFLLLSVVRACFVSFAQGQDFRQAVGLLVFEVVFLVLLCVLRVGRDKKSDWVFIVLAIFRVISWAVCVAFTRRANVTTIPRAIVGYALIVVTGIPIVWLFFLTVWDLFSALLPSKRRSQKPVAGEGNEKTQDDSYHYGHMGAGAAGAGAGAGTAGAAATSPSTDSSPATASSTSGAHGGMVRHQPEDANSPSSNPNPDPINFWQPSGHRS
ncbi:unnamed protein product [Parajaminaea phylloscopi]